MNKPLVLYTSSVLSHPPIGGPELRVENSIKALSQVAQVVLYCRKQKEYSGGNIAEDYLLRYCTRVCFAPKIPLIIRVASKLFGTLKAFSADRINSWWIYRDLKKVIVEVNPSVIWLGYGNISFSLLRYLKKRIKIPVVCDTDSVWSRFVGREKEFVTDPHQRKIIEKKEKQKEREEQLSTQLADVTTAVSRVDADYYKQYVKNEKRVQIFSNVIDLNSYKSIPDPAEDITNHSIYIAGSFFARGCPMEHAVRWFIEKVFPILKSEISDAQVIIIGKGSDQLLTDIKDPAINIKGRVDSVLPYLCHAGVIAVPLWFESGTRFKILEAGACKKAVVSTTIGAEGIPVTHGKNMLLTDEHEDFAEQIIRIQKDYELANTLGKNLYELIHSTFSLDSHAGEAQEIIRTVSSNNPTVIMP